MKQKTNEKKVNYLYHFLGITWWYNRRSLIVYNLTLQDILSRLNRSSSFLEQSLWVSLLVESFVCFQGWLMSSLFCSSSFSSNHSICSLKKNTRSGWRYSMISDWQKGKVTWRYQRFKRTISKYRPFFRFLFLQLFEKDEMGKIDVDHIEPKHKGNCPIFHILNKNQDTLPCPQWKHKKHANTKRICVHHYWSQRSAIFLDTRNCHYQHQLFQMKI